MAGYLFDEDLLLVSEDGANLLMRTYPIAFSITGKTWVNNHAHVLRFKNKAIQRFVEYYLNSIKLDKYVSGMAQPKLNQKMLNSIPVPFPNGIGTQKQVVEKLDELQSETQKLQTLYQQKLQALEDLKKSILQKAFAGELTFVISVSAFTKVIGISSTDLQASIIAFALKKHQGKATASTFGNVKAEKITNTAQYLLEIDLEREPYKDAAGPNDFTRLKFVQSRATKAGMFSVSKRGEGYDYHLNRQADSWIEKAKNALGQQWNDLERLIDLFVPMDTEQAEVVATVYAAWNNLLLDDIAITDEAIVTEARENWHSAKMKIEREKFFKSIDWLRRNNLVPKGSGQKIKAKESK